MNLNLGASDRHTPGYLCVDIAPAPCAVCDSGLIVAESILSRRVDLCLPWPWDDSSIDEILAQDVCEHIGSNCRIIGSYAEERGFRLFPPNGRTHFMNELWRVLKPGGRAIVETPNAAKGVGYFQDPTHTSPYCLSTFKYFEDGAFARQRLGDAYGITARFKVHQLTESMSNGEDPREQVWKIRAVLECVK